MNRRNFLKGSASLLALAPIAAKATSEIVSVDDPGPVGISNFYATQEGTYSRVGEMVNCEFQFLESDFGVVSYLKNTFEAT